MEKCVIDLFSSVTQIDKRYLNAIGTRTDRTNYPQVIENSFSAELYHRFKTLTELEINSSYYRNLILHFDISKYGGDLRPDIVLHEGQENSNNQKMFIEVKTNPRADLENDFNKLLFAISDLEFNNAVIILANRPFSESKNLISTKFQSLDFNKKKKLFLINIEILENDLLDYNLFSFTSIKIKS